MSPKRFAALAAAALLFPVGGHASAAEEAEAAAEVRPDPRATEILSRLDARLKSLRSLEGRFIQTFASSGLGIPQTESGTFSIRRPDRMRWEYTKPERKLAVSDGTHTWLYMPEEKVVYRGEVRDWKEGGAFALLAGGSLEGEFVAVSAGAEGAMRRGDVILHLRPSEPRDQYDSLLIEFEPSSLGIHSVTAIDAMGNRTSVVLSEVVENPDLDEDEFDFAPPEGVRVVDQARPRAPADVTGPSGR